MSAWEAYSFFQWLCGITVGDAINFLFALATVSVAVLAYRIQKSQTKYAELQTVIMHKLSEIEECKFKREEGVFKNKLFTAILHLTSRTFGDADHPADNKYIEFYALHRKEIPKLFPDEVQKLCELYEKFYATKGEAQKKLKDNILAQWLLVYDHAREYF